MQPSRLHYALLVVSVIVTVVDLSAVIVLSVRYSNADGYACCSPCSSDVLRRVQFPTSSIRRTPNGFCQFGTANALRYEMLSTRCDLTPGLRNSTRCEFPVTCSRPALAAYFRNAFRTGFGVASTKLACILVSALCTVVNTFRPPGTHARRIVFRVFILTVIGVSLLLSILLASLKTGFVDVNCGAIRSRAATCRTDSFQCAMSLTAILNNARQFSVPNWIGIVTSLISFTLFCVRIYFRKRLRAPLSAEVQLARERKESRARARSSVSEPMLGDAASGGQTVDISLAPVVHTAGEPVLAPSQV